MPKSVLIVEDEANIGIALEYLMRKDGYELRRVEDGEAALAAVEASPPDLILLDVMLPSRSGYDLCQTIRLNPALNRTKILLMTAKGGRNEREKGLALGADGFIAKPFATADLRAQVLRLLGDEPEK
ncbi:MAG TPA: response regulator [Paracoccaceae bacterium]|nr:response regulator [Paracoccaceae bacterium]